LRVHCTIKREFTEIESTICKINPLIAALPLDLGRLARQQPACSQKFTVSFIGRITKKKRLDIFFEVMRVLKNRLGDRYHDITFDVVGPDLEGLLPIYQIEYLDVLDDVAIHGELYGELLTNFYHNTDVFVLPSDGENFGIAAVEAGFSNCVTLLTAEVGVSEFFNETASAFCLIRQSADEIASRIISVFNSEELLETQKRACSESFMQFDLPNYNFRDIEAKLGF
jgi:glycosyltransferase involved in cell wall biosynthesis